MTLRDIKMVPYQAYFFRNFCFEIMSGPTEPGGMRDILYISINGPDFIQILSRFYPDFIQIPDFLETHCIQTLS